MQARKDSSSALVTADNFNLVLGTQAIGGKYQFTKELPLIEAARVIRAMGSNLIKFSLTANQDAGSAPKNLVEIARESRSVRAVLGMDFAHYLMWAYPVSAEAKRFQPGSLADEYREMYDLTRYLLRTFGGSGKAFYLGNWEGDWHLTHTDPNYTPAAAEVKNMTDWVNTRQRAVDDAKRDTPHRNVAVYHYLEVNRVVDATQGKVRLTNAVLPSTKLDFVSYSAYDAFSGKDLEGDLKRLLDYIASKLPAKPGITGRRVFIGEYGFPARNHTDAEQDRRSRQVLRASLAWGCRFCLYWELFNNEVQDGKQVGFWMINDKNVKQKIYFTHEQFYQRARRFVVDFAKKGGRVPTHAEFCRAAGAWLG